MKLTFATTAVAATLCLSAGCKKEEKAETPASGDAATAPAAADAGAAAAATNPAMLNQMKHCPSAVVGASTSVEKTDAAVLVIVNAKDPAGTTEVRDRAQHLAGVAGKDSPEIKHTGEGTGGGLGKCPVVLTGTTVAAEDIDGGVRITVTPTEGGKKVEEIYALAAERAKSLNERSGTAHGSGAGGGKGQGAGGGHGGQEKDDKAGTNDPEGDEANPAAGAGVVEPKPVAKKPAKKPVKKPAKKKKAAPADDEGGW